MIAPELRAELNQVFATRDRSHMAPTIEKLLRVLDKFPEEAEVLYEVGGAFDTDGQETIAADYYQRALDAGLEGKWLRQCYLQYGSTLRNLGRFDESLALLKEGLALFPNSESLTVFKALTLQAMGDSAPALGSLLVLIADRLHTEEIMRYEAAIRGNGVYLESLKAER